jgi:hypothetical protein
VTFVYNTGEDLSTSAVFGSAPVSGGTFSRILEGSGYHVNARSV